MWPIVTALREQEARAESSPAYTHLVSVSGTTARAIAEINRGLFARIYCHNRKVKTRDAAPPQPAVVDVLGGAAS